MNLIKKNTQILTLQFHCENQKKYLGSSQNNKRGERKKYNRIIIM